MPTAVRVEAAVAGRRRAGVAEHDVALDLSDGPTGLRDLIRAVVTAEVAGFTARAEHNSVVRVLTEAQIADGLHRGSVRSGGAPVQAVDVDTAIRTALLAFEDGLYRVYVDDEPVLALDEVVVVGEQSRLLFLRLVALAGG